MCLLHRLLILSLIVSAASACRRPEPVATGIENIRLATTDGLSIAATYRPVDAPNPPGLILVPMFGRTRETFDGFAERAHREGYAIVALDLRGHGDSDPLNGKIFRAFDTSDWQTAVRDLEAAYDYLVDQGVSAADIVPIGASIGANLALVYAANHTEIPAAVLLSPGLNYKGIEIEATLNAFGNRPLLILAGEADAYSAESSDALAESAEGQCELRKYDSGAHGTELFDAHGQAANQILLWLKPIVKANR